MKKLIDSGVNWSFVLLTTLMVFASCKEDVDIPNVPNPPIANVDPSKVTQGLIFENMTLKNASLPTVTTTVDLQIDSDSIFWTVGVTKRIKVKKPFGMIMQGVWIYVPGADSYIETTFNEDEETDEVGTLYFDFDPTEWDLPITFPVKIVPLDESGNPLGEFEVPVVIEKPHDPNASNCNWVVSNAQRWYWQYTKDPTYNIFHAPYKPIRVPGTTPGCCIGGQSEPNGFCSDEDTNILDYETVTLARSMFFTMYPDGKINGFEKSEYQNVEIFTSDFCSNTPSYTYTYGEGLTFELPLELDGHFTVNDCKMVIEDITLNETRIGAGSFVEFKLLSDHFLEEKLISSPDVPDGLGTARKIYEKTYYVIDQDGERWYD